MGPEDLLLYLCFHLDKHGFHARYWATRSPAEAVAGILQTDVRLIWYYDIWAILRQREEMAWATLVARARRWGIEEAVYTSLYFVTCLFGPSRATSILPELRRPQLSWLEMRGLESLSSLASTRDHAKVGDGGY